MLNNFVFSLRHIINLKTRQQFIVEVTSHKVRRGSSQSQMFLDLLLFVFVCLSSFNRTTSSFDKNDTIEYFLDPLELVFKSHKSRNFTSSVNVHFMSRDI